jgi:hypothetical protein
MIDYRKDRVDYGETLSPPLGFQLEYAVATTYSLDLFALLSIPVALFYSKNLDGKVSESRMDILDAIQKTSDKVKVYCQMGKIKVPKSFNKIVSFVDECVCEIAPSGEFTSFHPKVWVIKYSRKRGPSMFRVFVMSRNLTFDRSWDLSFYCEGFVGKSRIAKNQPLVDFVKHLTTHEDFVNSKSFLTELSKVEFEHDFKELDFHPMGLRKDSSPIPVSCENLLIVSPFVQSDALARWSDQTTGKKFLFSRLEELEKLDQKSLAGYNVYSFSDRIVDGEDYTDEGSEYEARTQNLHAKLFVCENTGLTSWFLGSANSTAAAIDRNVEFMVEFKSDQQNMKVDEVKKQLLGNDPNRVYFEPYQKTDRDTEASDDIEYEIRTAIHQLVSYVGNGGISGDCTISEIGADKYDITVSSAASEKVKAQNFEITFSLYCRDDYRPFRPGKEEKFIGVNLENLSPFLSWNLVHVPSGTEKEFITKMDISIPDGRKDAILRSIIRNKEKFFQFLQFLLGKDIAVTQFSDADERNEEEGGPGTGAWSQDSPILEELLLCVSRDPEKLKEVDQIITKLSSDKENSPIPADFLEFWSVFKPFAHG